MVEQFQQHRIRGLAWPRIALLIGEHWLEGATGAVISGWGNDRPYGLALQQQGAIGQYPGLPIGFQHQSGSDVNHHRRSAQQGGRGQLLASP